ncbi:unnamed protein product, partial [Meganyctiphanes norvegica]
ETKRAITELTEHEDLRNVDSTVVIIMSHGTKEYFYTEDGRKISFNYIVNSFNIHNCPALKGKPKFFIFDCCRGNESMRPLYLSKVQASPFTETNTDIIEDTTPAPIEVTTKDACIIHATV